MLRSRMSLRFALGRMAGAVLVAGVSGALVPSALAAGPRVVMSCPKRGEMKVMNAYVIKMPGDQVLPGNAGMVGTEWDLTRVELKHGEYLVLDCGYGAPNATPETPVAAKDHEARTIPADAGRCYMSNSPVKAECFAKQ